MFNLYLCICVLCLSIGTICAVILVMAYCSFVSPFFYMLLYRAAAFLLGARPAADLRRRPRRPRAARSASGGWVR